MELKRTMPKIAVSLSGGGYRASLFGLGTLLYLADAGKNAEVCCISSVSGGSITNGYVAQNGYAQSDSAAFWSDARHLARTAAHRTLWSTPAVWLYLTFLVVTLPVIICASFWMTPGPWWLRILLFVILLLCWGWMLQQRGILAGRALGDKLYSASGRPTRLDDIDRDIDHVICATHLDAGEHFYFSGRFVYSYRFGWGTPGGLPLHAAVQASAAFPGGFPPRWMRTARFGFEGGRDRPGPVPPVVTLTDGGVYDNMADQWPSGVARRAKRRPALELRVPDELIVVNSSAGLDWSSVRRLRIPLVGESLSLMRDVDVMYDNSASRRMKALVREFEDEEGLSGALVTIEQSPFEVPNAFDSGDSPRADRARAVRAKLGDEEEWKLIAKQDSAVATTLNKLGTEVAARLIRHGYATAMANLHVILNHPLLDVPDMAEFEALVE